MPTPPALGRQLIAELSGCPQHHLNNVGYVKQSLLAAAEAAGATIITSNFHHFSPYGVSGVVVIQESHLAIHTWPEYGYAAADLFTCGDSIDPETVLQQLQQAFGAQQVEAQLVQRGQQPALLSSQPVSAAATAPTRHVWFTEQLAELALSLRHEGELLCREHTGYQLVELYQTKSYGRLLATNGAIALTERDQWAYHEMLVHVPLFSHPQPKRVLLLGGGDGAALQQLLLHPQLAHITLVERDKQLHQLCKHWLPGAGPAAADPRVQLTFAEAANYLQGSSDHYDIILADIYQLTTTAANKQVGQLLPLLQQQLAAGGLLVTSYGPVAVQQAQGQQILAEAKKCFSQVRPYLAHWPTCIGGSWCFLLCSESEVVPQNTLFSGKYYSSVVHKAAFALPPHLLHQL